MFVLPVEFATPQYDETVRLRDKILRKPLGLEFYAKDLAKEYVDFHLACYAEDHTLLACLVLKHLSKDEIKMRQVAVDDTLQGKGIGTEIVKASERFAKQKGYKKIVLNARDVAVPFYLKMDYQKIGKPFTEVTIKHYKMEKTL